MKKGLKELIQILANEDRKEEILRQIVKGELRQMMRELLEEIALVERSLL